MDELFRTLFESPVIGGDTVGELLLHLLAAFVLGQLVAWVYAWTHHGVSYSRSQVQSLVLLSLIVTIVMLAIGGSLARAFGLFGALALIRFRTPIKDARDAAFLFLSVGVGITVGTRNLQLAIVGTCFALAVAVYLGISRFGERDAADSVLRFSMPNAGDAETRLRALLRHYCSSFALMHLREGGSASMDFAYRLRLVDPTQSSALLADLSTIPGVRGASLLVQDEELEV